MGRYTVRSEIFGYPQQGAIELLSTEKKGGFHTYFSMIEKCRGLLNRKG